MGYRLARRLWHNVGGKPGSASGRLPRGKRSFRKVACPHCREPLPVPRPSSEADELTCPICAHTFNLTAALRRLPPLADCDFATGEICGNLLGLAFGALVSSVLAVFLLPSPSEVFAIPLGAVLGASLGEEVGVAAERLVKRR